MEALEVLSALNALKAHVAVLDGAGAVVAVNTRWRRFRPNGASPRASVGDNYLDVCAEAAGQGNRDAVRVHRRLRRLLDGGLDGFGLVYPYNHRFFRLRATRIVAAPVRVLVSHEDITTHLAARRKLRIATAGLTDIRNRHASRIGEAYEELGQRLAAIALAAHAIERASQPSAAVTTIRIAVDEARRELRVLRYRAESEAD